MRLFSLHPEIHSFEKLSDFLQAFAIGAGDLIFTEKVIFDAYVAQLSLPCSFLIRDDYEVGEPSEEAIDRMLQRLNEISYTRMVAIGGGSVMDTAKALVIKDAYPFANLLNKTETNINTHTLINVPTTCGTGAEISSGGIYFSKSNGLKSAVVGGGVDYAVLIPELIERLPFKIFFLSSMDALSHAVEGYLYAEDTVNEFGLAIAEYAIRTILDAQAALYLNGAAYRLKLCRQFLTASTMGNLALTANGANLVHAMAYPVAEKFHLAHGESVYQYLLPVLRLYQRINPQEPRLTALKRIIAASLGRAGFSGEDALVFDQLQQMLNRVYPLRSMTEVGMTREDIPAFTENIVETKQRLLKKALCPVTGKMIREMYEERL